MGPEGYGIRRLDEVEDDKRDVQVDSASSFEEAVLTLSGRLGRRHLNIKTWVDSRLFLRLSLHHFERLMARLYDAMESL